MMRIKIFGVLLAAVAIASATLSCQKDTSVQDGRYPILFDCADYNTRATTSESLLQSDGFRVYAYLTTTVDETTTSTYQFVKDVYYDNDNSKWTYQNVEYWWPETDYFFTAVYPKEGYFTLDNESSSQVYSITGYNVTDQKDLMVAKSNKEVAGGAVPAPVDGSVVDLSFQHLLSCVVIKLKSEITGVTVSEVSFTNIAQNGNCTNGSWEFGTTTDMLKYSPNLTLDINAEGFVDATNGGFRVIPQQINGNQYINITTTDKTYQAVIPDITWESGNKYTYSMTIKQDNIVFSEPTVVEWDEENATGSVIIK